MKSIYQKIEITPLGCGIREGVLLVDSGKEALTITPIDAQVTPYVFEDAETHDFGEISFL